MSATRIVQCDQHGCQNDGVPIELIDDGTSVVCGPCGMVLAEQAEWYEPPTPEELGMPTVPEQAADLIAQMTPEERAELAALIAPPTVNDSFERKQ